MRHPRTAPRTRECRGTAAPSWTACLAPRSLRRTGVIALAVGACLVAINQLPGLIHGPRPAAFWLRVALDFLVPFLVSNLGVLTGSRALPGRREAAAGTFHRRRDRAGTTGTGSTLSAAGGDRWTGST